MAFTDTKVAGQIIQSADWNEFVDFSEYISGSYFGHSSNKDIHFPSSSIVDWLNSVYAPIGRAGEAWSGAVEFYSFSSNVKEELSDLYSFSSNTSLIKTGYVNVTNGDTIAHGLSRLPTYANVSPSGFNVNFGVSCKVDETNITVYLTAIGSRDVFWLAAC